MGVLDSLEAENFVHHHAFSSDDHDGGVHAIATTATDATAVNSDDQKLPITNGIQPIQSE